MNRKPALFFTWKIQIPLSIALVGLYRYIKEVDNRTEYVLLWLAGPMMLAGIADLSISLLKRKKQNERWFFAVFSG